MFSKLLQLLPKQRPQPNLSLRWLPQVCPLYGCKNQVLRGSGSRTKAEMAVVLITTQTLYLCTPKLHKTIRLAYCLNISLTSRLFSWRLLLVI